MGGGKMHTNLRLTNYSTGNATCDNFHTQRMVGENQCTSKLCKGSMMSLPGLAGSERSKEEVARMAKDFFDEFYTTTNNLNGPEHTARWTRVRDDIDKTGSYQLTEPELLFGAKLSWRNASRCIGRIQWNKLKLFDARHVATPREMFDALCTHIEYATNKGNIRSTITIFPQREEGKNDFRVWNPQLVSYAGYKNDDGTITGDPGNVVFTQICTRLGWKGPGTMWDILPLVLSSGGSVPEVFDIPEAIILRVPLVHPTYWWFQELGLQWYALPAVAGMLFDVGGIQFPACPFNGWYMSTEVGCRDLCDPQRYNILEAVATELGEDTANDATLWKDRALVEVNVAVLHSFQQKAVTIVDHHTASDNFVKHLENEQKLRKGCPADWVWIVPPMSASLTSVYHQEMAMYNVKPSYDYQTPAWKTHQWTDLHLLPKCRFTFKHIARVVQASTRLYLNALKRRINVTILYATETGRSQQFSEKLSQIFAHGFNPSVCCMDDYDAHNLCKETFVLVVTSTFGNGDAPVNGVEFARKLNSMNRSTSVLTVPPRISSEAKPQSTKANDLSKLKYAVFALGSSVYPNFCAFGHHIDGLLAGLGAHRLTEVGEGDEVSGQQKPFRTWFTKIYPAACETFKVTVDRSVLEKELSAYEVKLTEESVRFVSARGEMLESSLTKSAKKPVKACKVLRKTHLYKNEEHGTSLLLEVASDDSYQPGDHVGVMPENRPEVVEGVIARLAGKVNPNNVVKLQSLNVKNTSRGTIRTWSPYGQLPTCSLRVLLTRFLDITTPLRPSQLESLAALAEHAEHKAKLTVLATDLAKYDAWRSWRLPTLLEVLEEFPSVRLTPALLVTVLKPLQPRFYSISSSPEASKGEIHLTVAVVTYNSEGGSGPKHYGVCSNYLDQLKPGDDIFMFIRSAHNFSLPLDVSKPVIMVGPGTGIAPFRGFWQHRRAQFQNLPSVESRKEFGEMWLFFGSRNKSLDLFRAEKEECVRDGILSKTFLALSREPNVPKTYVQSLLEKEGAAVYKKLNEEGGHMFVCGDVTMAEGVHKMLLLIVKQHGQVNDHHAEEFIKLLKEEKRYHEDIFGVTVHTTPTTSAVTSTPTAAVTNTNPNRTKPKNSGFVSRMLCCSGA